METGLTGLNEIEIAGALRADGAVDKESCARRWRGQHRPPADNRASLPARATLAEIQSACKYEPWFLAQVEALVDAEATVRREGYRPTPPPCCA